MFDRVKGPYAWDVDGNKYVDYIGSWGPAICGHAHPEVISALQEAIEKGTSFGAPCALENTLAEMVIEAVPSVEMVRFVNSGTEACMSMLRLIRAFTGRDKIIKFEGCYHGHADMFLVKAGSGVATLGLPDSPGVPRSTTANTLTAPYNDLESVKQLFAENPDAIAGVFEAKGRPASDPLIVHVDGVAMAETLIEGGLPAVAARLAAAFWPGPLTMVLPKTQIVPDAITSSGPTVGVRCPAHPVARALITARPACPSPRRAPTGSGASARPRRHTSSKNSVTGST